MFKKNNVKNQKYILIYKKSAFMLAVALSKCFGEL